MTSRRVFIDKHISNLTTKQGKGTRPPKYSFHFISRRSSMVGSMGAVGRIVGGLPLHKIKIITTIINVGISR